MYKNTAVTGSILMIVYCILYPYLSSIPYLISAIRIMFILLWLFVIVGIICNYLFSYIHPKEKILKDSFIKTFYLKSYQIIVQAYCYYFIVYMIFFLDRKSVLFNYLMLLLLGLFLGYKAAIKAEQYKDKRKNK